MKPVLFFGDIDYRDIARRHVRELGKSAQQVLTTSAKRIVHRAIVLTPPTVGAMAGDFKQQLDAGKKAIRRDVFGTAEKAGVLMVVNRDISAGIRRSGKQRSNRAWLWLFNGPDGKGFFCHREQYKPNAGIAEIRAFHMEHRGSRGNPVGLQFKDFVSTLGNTVSKRYKHSADGILVPGLVVSKSAARAYIAFLDSHIGWAKAAWNRALLSLGGKVRADKAPPSWITRHHNSPGSVIKKIGDGKSEIIFENHVGYANRWANASRILSTAFAEERTKMSYDLGKALESMAERENKKRIT